MKKFFSLILAFSIIYGFCQLAKLRFGYVKRGIKIEERVIGELDNGNVLFSGYRLYSPKKGFEEAPFKIYNPNKNKIIDEFNLPINFLYDNDILLLKDNKILILKAFEAKRNIMILYDINKKLVEKVIKNKQDENFETALENGKIFIGGNSPKLFDIENETIKFINTKNFVEGNYRGSLVYKGDLLIFKENKNGIFIYRYDTKNETIKLFRQIKNVFEYQQFPYITDTFLIDKSFEKSYDINNKEIKNYKRNMPKCLHYQSKPKMKSFNNGKYFLVLNALAPRHYYFGFSVAYAFDIEKGSMRPMFYKPLEFDETTLLKLKNGDIFIYDNERIKIFKPWVK